MPFSCYSKLISVGTITLILDITMICAFQIANNENGSRNIDFELIEGIGQAAKYYTSATANHFSVYNTCEIHTTV